MFRGARASVPPYGGARARGRAKEKVKEVWTVQKVFITATARTKESILIGFEEGGGGVVRQSSHYNVSNCLTLNPKPESLTHTKPKSKNPQSLL